MKKDFVFQIQDNFIDLSQIKTFKVAKHYANDNEKKRIEIELRDRIQFVNGRRDDFETISDKIDIFFPDEVSAQKACKELSDEWEKYIKNNLTS